MGRGVCAALGVETRCALTVDETRAEDKTQQEHHNEAVTKARPGKTNMLVL